MRTITAILLISFINPTLSQTSLKVLNFQGDNGYQHSSKDEAINMVNLLGSKNGWEVITSSDPKVINSSQLDAIDVIVFNNNCGTDGRIFSDDQQRALQDYIRNGGGFVGIHCAGAIWKEEGEFQVWFEQLIGTRLVTHPKVQYAKLIVENQDHSCTAHLPKEWVVEDEWHNFSFNPRDNVNVLISLDENSYEGDSTQKMNGDHPFTWFQYYDGGRSFFTSLGHTETVYKNDNYQKMIESGILWAAGIALNNELPVTNGLILDLNADKDVETKDDEVIKWTNQVKGFSGKDFIAHDYGVRLSNPGSGKPTLNKNIEELNGHHALVFEEDELINMKEDAFDYLLTGSGYTWFTIIKPYKTADPNADTEFDIYRLKDVNSFMGNLKNGGNYEGLLGSLDDDLTVWCGSRNGITFGRFDENNPKVTGPKLEANKYYIVAARMGAGIDSVDLELFVNNTSAIISGKYPVNPNSNPSKFAIGTERNATNHPGSASFNGEISRFIIYEKPLTNQDMGEIINYLKKNYTIND